MIVISLAAAFSVASFAVLANSAIGSINVTDVNQNSANYETGLCNSCHDKFGSVSGGPAAGGIPTGAISFPSF